jgi:hypothetical protein
VVHNGRYYEFGVLWVPVGRPGEPKEVAREKGFQVFQPKKQCRQQVILKQQ